MIFTFPSLLILGAFAYIFWLLNTFKIVRSLKLNLPETYKAKGSLTPLLVVFILGSIAWYNMSIGIAQPRKAIGNEKSNVKVNDIFFVVDVSKSMEAVDFRPNRLAVAKEKIYEFINLRPTDRMGIIMFSEAPFTLLPLTFDHELVKKSVSDIVIGPLGQGTNIGDALSLAVARGSLSKTLNKIIVLLTDGVSMMGSITPLQAAKMAAEKGIKVYSIGIGKIESKKVLRNNFGQYQNLPGGSVDLETLQKISEETGGKSFYAGDKGSLKEVFDKIQQLEKIEIEAHKKIVYEELYWNYLLIGLVLLLLVELVKKYWLKDLT